MLDRNAGKSRRTPAADRGYDTADFVADCRERGTAPHVAMNITGHRDTALDRRTTPHEGYLISQHIRKRIEECFGWAKDGRPLRKMKVCGKDRVGFLTTLTVGCYTPTRVAKLLGNPRAGNHEGEVSTKTASCRSATQKQGDQAIRLMAKRKRPAILNADSSWMPC